MMAVGTTIAVANLYHHKVQWHVTVLLCNGNSDSPGYCPGWGMHGSLSKDLMSCDFWFLFLHWPCSWKNDKGHWKSQLCEHRILQLLNLRGPVISPTRSDWIEFEHFITKNVEYLLGLIYKCIYSSNLKATLGSAQQAHETVNVKRNQIKIYKTI